MKISQEHITASIDESNKIPAGEEFNAAIDEMFEEGVQEDFMALMVLRMMRSGPTTIAFANWIEGIRLGRYMAKLEAEEAN